MTPDIGLGNWLYQRALRTPGRAALTFEGTTWIYAALQERIDRLASGLRANGVCQGDRVGFLGFNQPAFLETLFAAARLGAIFVPLNFRLSAPELEYIINNAGLHTLVVDTPHQPIIDPIRAALPCRRYLSADRASDGWPSIPDLIASHDPLKAGVAVAEDEVAVIMFTSGTTGRPKGAMLTHGNIWWNNVNVLHAYDVLESDVSLLVAPLFHIGGLNVNSLVIWQKGGHVVLHRGFDPTRCLADVGTYQVTTMFAVPAMLLFLSQHPEFASANLSSLKTIVCGGAPVPEPLMRLYASRGIPINQGYGLTETAPIVTFLAPEWAMSKLGSAGKPPMFSEVKLVDANGKDISKPRVNGEVVTRGPNIMKGYWNNPEATAAAIDTEGWFHTGDVGYCDEDGFLYIADRLKDMVITGGENVYPAEVESVLYDHPAIAEIAVIGLPDAQWGEAVVAVAALKPGAGLELEELRVFATDRLARFKLPRRLEVVAALPRNPAGKVLKYELRALFAAADRPIG
ncbi:MAG: long-chain-fatty-acid--CoA ligase [Acetobacteraceae bacterium]|nr:long-chain-fatty-acid--CoA ligase [Acetobacteraceae bacterium]